MKILLDENLPHELRAELVGHDVYTVQYLGWSGMKNGLLLVQAVASGFGAMLTMDSGVPYQQNLATISIALVVLSAPSNDIADLRPLVPRILDVIKTLKPTTVVKIE